MRRSHRSAQTIDAPREKVTITLRPDTLAYADRKARESGVSRSEVIDAALADAAEREIEALMTAGYKAMSRENLELAEEDMESFWQVIKDEPEWPSAPSVDDGER